jgi:hypothetical protein
MVGVLERLGLEVVEEEEDGNGEGVEDGLEGEQVNREGEESDFGEGPSLS